MSLFSKKNADAESVAADAGGAETADFDNASGLAAEPRNQHGSSGNGAKKAMAAVSALAILALGAGGYFYFGTQEAELPPPPPPVTASATSGGDLPMPSPAISKDAVAPLPSPTPSLVPAVAGEGEVTTSNATTPAPIAGNGKDTAAAGALTKPNTPSDADKALGMPDAKALTEHAGGADDLPMPNALGKDALTKDALATEGTKPNDKETSAKVADETKDGITKDVSAKDALVKEGTAKDALGKDAASKDVAKVMPAKPAGGDDLPMPLAQEDKGKAGLSATDSASEKSALPLDKMASTDKVPAVDGGAAIAAIANKLEDKNASSDKADLKKDGDKVVVKEGDKTTNGASAAEEAIVQGGAALDQLSHPKDAKLDIAPISGAKGEPAIVRPLPPRYLVIHKNSDSGTHDARLTSAQRSLAENRNQSALELFTDLSKDYPEDSAVLMGRAIALQRNGQYDAALQAYERVLSKEPKNLSALTNMLGLLKRTEPSLAVSKLVELREIYPANAEITAQLAIAYGATSNFDEALKYINIAQDMAPENHYITYNKAVLLDKMGRRSEAATLYRKIVQMAADGSLDVALPVDSIRQRLGTLQ